MGRFFQCFSTPKSFIMPKFNACFHRFGTHDTVNVWRGLDCPNNTEMVQPCQLKMMKRYSQVQFYCI